MHFAIIDIEGKGRGEIISPCNTPKTTCCEHSIKNCVYQNILELMKYLLIIPSSPWLFPGFQVFLASSISFKDMLFSNSSKIPLFLLRPNHYLRLCDQYKQGVWNDRVSNKLPSSLRYFLLIFRSDILYCLLLDFQKIIIFYIFTFFKASALR